MAKLIENLLLTDIHSAGKAIGQHQGKNIFVPFGIPGETVNVLLDRRQRGFYSGTIEDIKLASDKRIQPFCRHYGICGGCNWQHMDYQEQLRLKRQILLNALRKYKIETPEIPQVVPSDDLYFFRNKVEYAFEAIGYDGVTNEEIRNCLGYHPIEVRNRVINIEECRLQREPSRKICEAVKRIAIKNDIPFYHYPDRSGLLRNVIIRTSTTGETLAILGFTTNDPEKITMLLKQLKDEVPEISSLCCTILTDSEKGYMDGEIVNFYGTGYLSEQMGEIGFRISPKAFFQPNPKQAQKIYGKVLKYLEPKGNELVYDLYTGAGTIACFVASKVRSVIGVEGSADAIHDAGLNARLNNLQNTRFICGDVLQTFTADFVEAYGKPDVVILDPPRAGTLIEIKKTIIKAAPSKIIYVSCNPVSLAFDLTMLTNGYRVSQIQPYDMFPHTHHVETVVLLEKQ